MRKNCSYKHPAIRDAGCTHLNTYNKKRHNTMPDTLRENRSTRTHVARRIKGPITQEQISKPQSEK